MYEGRLLKNKLRTGKVCLGTWISFTDPTVAELLTESGFDFFIIDSEHAPLDVESVQMNIMATKGTEVTPIVRVAWNDPVLIKRVLDVGAGGVLVPMIRTPQDVRNAVMACMYPPTGIRGYGPRRPAGYERHSQEYIASANDNIVVWAQIEHIEAVNNIEEIVATRGLAGLLIGSNDLSGSMGMLGQPRHPEVLSAIDKVIAAGKRSGIPVGLAGPADPQLAGEWIGKGIQFITLGGDQGYLVQASEAVVKEVKQGLIKN